MKLQPVLQAYNAMRKKMTHGSLPNGGAGERIDSSDFEAAPQSSNRLSISSRAEFSRIPPPSQSVSPNASGPLHSLTPLIEPAARKPVSLGEHISKPLLAPPVIKNLHRESQILLLQESKSFVIQKNQDLSKAEKLANLLSRSLFDEDLKHALFVCRGLLQLISGNAEGCIDDMLQVLSFLPQDRLALVYLMVADMWDSFQVIQRKKYDFIEASKRNEVWRKTTKNLFPSKSDIFARLVRLTQDGEIGFTREILEELEEITQQAPQEPLGWSMLAAHCFFMMSALGRHKMLKPAEDSAFEALRLKPDDKLSMSVLWWSGSAVSRKREFQNALNCFQLSASNLDLYNPGEVSFQNAFEQKVVSFDRLLEPFLSKIISF